MLKKLGAPRIQGPYLYISSDNKQLKCTALKIFVQPQIGDDLGDDSSIVFDI